MSVRAGKQFISWETHYTYTPSDARAARTLCCDDVRAERVPWVCGVHEGLRGALGVHDAQWILKSSVGVLGPQKRPSEAQVKIVFIN